MRILAVESSCDENSAAILEGREIRSLVTVTQSVHQSWGGVVPELAGRSHLELQDDVVLRALSAANLDLSDMDAVAATCGPGLVGSLLVGYHYASGLALALNTPFVAVHHMEAHLWSVELEREPANLPMLVLLVSGGHTLLILVRDFRDYEILGQTRDDALGEAYDKVGKLLGLSFPAGAEMDALAQQGNSNAVALPIAMRDKSLDFSYSGLKTAVSNLVNTSSEYFSAPLRNDLIASFQRAAIQSALEKVRLAFVGRHIRTLAAAGGVAANSELRSGLQNIAEEFGVPLAVPPMKYCADNAAMVGYVAAKHLSRGHGMADSKVRPRWPLSELNTVSNRNC
ncbi:MAG: tRNA (adenosine(37)-N6)-threonylcarbamoyltransferase complex transferase subunit TsaD [Calditrichaeota bacterium]|nr:tRNA (adenosine(37)-N6)-threonylcarbamoyltransferase complex transferase subunit TsaD [Calditrichota bacterium]MCB9366544.1 tRNA (adenosine(37)-N6)-threonylcarbamoyltransferase complex transferase subunit TsaD [Calditrichota bacterium]MCB9391198.1 tRNA (adenosine(37)-N6)-threonylcarbamoyltransferase complex transferase subunit TsaD [Calditrichota bacterium]